MVEHSMVVAAHHGVVGHVRVTRAVGVTEHAMLREAGGPRTSRRRRLRQALTLALSVWIAVASTLLPVARAQSGDTDFRAPVIEHDPEAGGFVGEIETFVANVVDDDRLDSVTLFHRYAGETEFDEQPMRQTASSSFYSARIDTTDSETTVIEYYIRAEDASGNIALSGFAFEPLERVLMPIEAAEPPTEPAVVAEPARKINWLYVGLGVLVLGGVAAGLSGGGGDDGGGGMPSGAACDPDCEVTLTVSVP